MTIITVYVYILFSNLTWQFGSNFSMLWQILICIVQATKHVPMGQLLYWLLAIIAYHDKHETVQ